MDMPPSGWYPDPYGVTDLLRWWDGSTWTQHTHEGSAPESPDAAGTSLDMTRIGGAPVAARAPLDPTVVQPAVKPGEATLMMRGTAQPRGAQPGTSQGGASQGGASQAAAGQAAAGQQPKGQQGVNPSWPSAGSPGGYGTPPRQDGDGTRVLLVNESPWASPGKQGGYGGRHGATAPRDYQRRRRMMLGGLLAGGTAIALGLIALVVSNLSSSAPPATTAAQTTPPPASAPATQAASPTPSSQAPTASPTPSVSTVAGGVADSISGLSYSLLSSPWANGCPASLSNQQTATWTAGEAALAGQVSSNGQQVNWYGEACSGPLPQNYGYNSVADLEPAAMNLLNAIDGPYYGALNHSRTQLASTPVSVSGHPGWEIKYLMTYPDAASQGLAWNSEEGAIVLADQGTGLPPAAFIVSVPSNLNVATVDTLVASLTLTPAQQPGQPTTTAPGNGNGGGNGNGNHP